MVRTITRRLPVLARYARRFLFVEFVTYGLAAGVLVRAGMGWWVLPVTILGIALLMRVLAVASTFLVAAALSPAGESTSLPAAGRLSIIDRFRLVALEIVWTTLAYSLLMPFPRLFGRRNSRLPVSLDPRTVPVLLVHGYVCNGGIWAPMQRFLESSGVATYTHDLEPVYAGIDTYVGALATRIEEICRETGAQRLIIVAHSMGGLAARAYLRTKGGGRIAKLVTLGTPHHGTRTAPMGLGPNARQMEPGSAWLADLARDERPVPAVPVTSIYSSDDNVVVPQDSSVLVGAKNLRVSGIGHVSLAFSRTVQDAVLKEIREPRAN